MAEFEGLKWLAQQGVGVMFAGVVFHIYRTDQKTNAQALRDLISDQNKKHEESIKRFEDLTRQAFSIVEGNTRAVTALTEIIRRSESDEPISGAGDKNDRGDNDQRANRR